VRLLLLSNSTNFGSTFLGHAAETIREFLGTATDLLFVPYAAVRFSYDEFVARVQERLGPLGCTIHGIHQASDPVTAVRSAKAIAVGGGNTFRLLSRLYELELLDPIRQRVRAGAPYVGWSAGSNVAGLTIRTTDDMPIVEPPSFEALGLFPAQINPHYTDAVIPNHGGETRSDRLLEFIALNPNVPVIALREGSILRVDGEVTTLLGSQPALGFQHGVEPWSIAPGVVAAGFGRQAKG
jgi:dipeptidase E